MMTDNTSNTLMKIREREIMFVSCDSWNYTFHSLGSMATILLLNLCSNFTYDKPSILWSYGFHVTSLIGIMFVSNKYFDNYIMNYKRLTTQDKCSFGI